MPARPSPASPPASELFRALADPTRRRLLERLVAGPVSAGELSRILAIPRVNVSHHLSVLAAAGLVDLRQRQAAARPDAFLSIRHYFDEALTAAAITISTPSRAVASQSRS